MPKFLRRRSLRVSSLLPRGTLLACALPCALGTSIAGAEPAAPAPAPPSPVAVAPPPPSEPAALVAASEPAFVIEGAPGKGLTARVGDAFSMNLRTRVQLRYQLDGSAEDANEDRDYQQLVNVGTARLWISGNVYVPELRYMIQLAVAGRDYRDGATSPLFDAYLDYRVHRDFAVRVGQFFVPFDRLRTVREFALQMADRPLPVGELTLDRDVGVAFYSEQFLGTPLAWRVGVFGGGGTNLSVGKEPGALVMGRLARHHDVYALDLLGHGLSGLPAGRHYATVDEHVAAVAGLIRQVVRRPALVVGNSLGGMLGVRLAWAEPELVRGLVLLNPGGAPLGGRATYDEFFAKISDTRLSAAYRVSGELIGRVPRLLLVPLLRSLQHMFQRPVILEAYGASDDSVFLSPEHLRRLPVPAGLIWGLRDRFLPEGSFGFFDENLPGAPRLLLPRCGHLPQRECPLRVVRFVLSFADRLDALSL